MFYCKLRKNKSKILFCDANSIIMQGIEKADIAVGNHRDSAVK